ncbi:MAG: plasmid stabilization protein [Candidatus Dadabacteria bacterium]|nr:plasmid stabilization protein [Candidatus Dadabacteria bacterium]
MPDGSPKVAKPEDGLLMGDALAMIWGEVGLTDDEFTALKQEIAKNKKLAEPMRFE